MSRTKLLSSLYLAGTGLTFLGKTYYDGSQALSRFRNGETVRVETTYYVYGSNHGKYETKYELNSEKEAIEFEITRDVTNRVIKSVFFPYIGLNCASRYLMTSLIIATNKPTSK